MPAPMPLLHVVSGKGGTGKTTMSAALACALADAPGRRVLLCEVEGRQQIAELFDTSPLEPGEERQLVRTPRGGVVLGLSIDAESALQEYLETFYRLGIAGKALDRFGVFEFATSIAPGLRDVLLTGKVYEAVRRRTKKRRDAFDAVVLDAPPTGRITRFLNVHEAVSDLAKVGPIRKQADSIVQVFRSEQTAVHLVSTAEEMPVTEAREAVTELTSIGLRVASVIANRLDLPGADDPEPYAPQLAAVRDGSQQLSIPGLDAPTTNGLAAELVDEVARLELQERCLGDLAEIGLPMGRVAELDRITPRAMLEIGTTLASQLDLGEETR